MSRLLPGFMMVALSLSFALPAHAAKPQYRAALTGASESPENGSAGTGNVRITVDPEDHTLRIQGMFGGLLAKTTGAHLDVPASNPANGTIAATAIPAFSGFPVGVKSGSFNKTLDLTQKSTYNPAFLSANGGSASRAEKALLAMLAAGKGFFNLTTAGMPGGEIGGFLQPFDPTPVSSASWTKVKALYR